GPRYLRRFLLSLSAVILFFFTPPAPTAIYPLSLHDALPIFRLARVRQRCDGFRGVHHRSAAEREHEVGPRRFELGGATIDRSGLDRKSTRLNSSHLVISYAVFCLKKKKNNIQTLKSVKYIRD